MPVLFHQICELLADLEAINHHDPPYLSAQKNQFSKARITQWFSRYAINIYAPLEELVAILSAIFPARRSDRVYSIRPRRLTLLLKRCLRLGTERSKLLDQWRMPNGGDLPDCVERAMQPTDDPLTLARQRLSLAHVDSVLNSMAARSRFSNPQIRQSNDDGTADSVETIFPSMHSRDAKWLTRMILKEYSCLDFETNHVFRAIDDRLPGAMQMYDDFRSALSELKRCAASRLLPAGVDQQDNQSPSSLFSPRVGVKVGAPKWAKAQGGVKHAVTLCKGQQMSVERKYDGEYCQVHIDLKNMEAPIRIFSKSKKDSTVDRMGVHEAIRRGLRLGEAGCRFKKNCILDGELLVWSTKDNEIMEFHKIRKHVSRSGSFLGTELDSQPHAWEQLMIMYYDVLLIDDEPVLHLPYETRRTKLRKIVRSVEGVSEFAWRKAIDFSDRKGPRRLQDCLANALARRWEGLVLKPSHEPYIRLDAGPGNWPTPWIKLKKDCIQGLGDTADFLVIGAGYDAASASTMKIPNLYWTHFFLECLEDDPLSPAAEEPTNITVVACVNSCLKTDDIRALNRLGVFQAMEFGSADARSTFRIKSGYTDLGVPTMTTVFRKPFVFDIAGSGFDKSPNTDLFMLRFPRVVRVHWDRYWRETVSFPELQRLALEARSVSEDLNLEVKRIRQHLQALDKDRATGKASWEMTDSESSHSPRVQTLAKKTPAKGAALERDDRPHEQHDALLQATPLEHADSNKENEQPIGEEQPQHKRNSAEQQLRIAQKEEVSFAVWRVKPKTSMPSPTRRAVDDGDEESEGEGKPLSELQNLTVRYK